MAQDGDRILAAGSVLSGALGIDASAAAFVFDARANSTASVTLDNVTGAALALNISDINGNTIGQASTGGEAGSSAQVETQISSGGRYFAFVFTFRAGQRRG